MLLEAARLRGSLTEMALFPRHAIIPCSVGQTLPALRKCVVDEVYADVCRLVPHFCLTTSSIWALLVRHDHAIYGLGVARKSPIYATSSDDKSFKVCELIAGLGKTKNFLAVKPHRLCLPFYHLCQFQIWQFDRPQPLQVVSGNRDWLRAIALTTDGTLAIVGGYDATLAIYDILSGQVSRKPWNCAFQRRLVAKLFTVFLPNCERYSEKS